jgi:hypothetical protein
MIAKVNEIKALTNNEQLIAEADRHVQLLKELRSETEVMVRQDA